MSIAQYSFPTQIYFGAGVTKEVTKVLKALGLKKPLVVTDRDLRKLPILESFLENIEQEHEVFSEVFGNPVKSQVVKGADAYKRFDADSIVAIGGGAPMDVAKAIAVLVNHPGDLFDYEDRPGAKPIDQELPKIIAIPTTAGTGSEVGRAAVISDDESKKKRIIFTPGLLPKVVLADPELLFDLPAKITAATGMDALTHLVEAIVAPGDNPLCDGIGFEGLHLLSQGLIPSFEFASKTGDRSPAHLEARAHMLNASMMGAIAFQKGLGATHSCAHALSTVKDLHHGLANGIMIPFVMKFNEEFCQKKFQRICYSLGANHGFVPWLKDLQKRLEIPQKLSQVGVSEADLETLAEHAFVDPVHQTNPRPVTKDDFLKIFQEAL